MLPALKKTAIRSTWPFHHIVGLGALVCKHTWCLCARNHSTYWPSPLLWAEYKRIRSALWCSASSHIDSRCNKIFLLSKVLKWSFHFLHFDRCLQKYKRSCLHSYVYRNYCLKSKAIVDLSWDCTEREGVPETGAWRFRSLSQTDRTKLWVYKSVLRGKLGSSSTSEFFYLLLNPMIIVAAGRALTAGATEW